MRYLCAVADERGRFKPVDTEKLGIASNHAEIDTSIAHPARVYDYLLGGKDNFEPDRVVGDRLINAIPDIQPLVLRNRAFIRRAVRHLVEDEGIEQIIDVGTGIPTSPAVHQIAREINPGVRVAYVDNDPIVLAHDRALLSREEGVVTYLGDLMRPESVLDHPGLRELIDFDRPIALLFAAVIHFVTDDQDPHGIIAAYRSRLPRGSAMVISHVSTTRSDPRSVADFVSAYQTSSPVVFRSTGEIRGLFTGFDLIEPGVVPLHEWRPDTDEQAEEGGISGDAGVGILR